MNKILTFIRAHKKTALICLILALVLIWYVYPVTLLTNREAEKTASVFIRDGRNGKEVVVSDPDIVAYLADYFQDRKFYRDDLALGMGMSCFWEFYDENGETLCDIRMRDTASFKQGIWFHTPIGDDVNYKALFAYSAKLARWGTDGGEMPQPPTAEDFATPDIPVGAELAKYTFDTDHITYWVDETGPNSELHGYLKLEITEEETLQAISDDIDLQNHLQPIPVAEQFDDYAPEQFLDFHNGIVLAYYGNYVWLIETSTFGDSAEDFQINDGMIGPYYRYWAFGEFLDDDLYGRILSLYESRNPAVTLVQWE